MPWMMKAPNSNAVGGAKGTPRESNGTSVAPAAALLVIAP